MCKYMHAYTYVAMPCMHANTRITNQFSYIHKHTQTQTIMNLKLQRCQVQPFNSFGIYRTLSAVRRIQGAINEVIHHSYLPLNGRQKLAGTHLRPQASPPAVPGVPAAAGKKNGKRMHPLDR